VQNHTIWFLHTVCSVDLLSVCIDCIGPVNTIRLLLPVHAVLFNYSYIFISCKLGIHATHAVFLSDILHCLTVGATLECLSTVLNDVLCIYVAVTYMKFNHSVSSFI